MSLHAHETNGKGADNADTIATSGGSGERGASDVRGAIDKGEKETIAALMRIGCDLRTASWATGHAPVEVKETLGRDGAFVRDVQKAESSFEFKHLQHLDKAAEEPKNWRVSMWLLERRLPEKYERQRPRTIKESQLMPLLKSLADAVVEGVDDAEQRAALLERVKATVDELDSNAPLGPENGF